MPSIKFNAEPVGYLWQYGGLDNIVITDVKQECGYIPLRYYKSYGDVPVYEGRANAKGKLFIRMPNNNRKKRGICYRLYFRPKD